MNPLSVIFKLTVLTTLIVGQVYGCDQESMRDAYQIFLEQKERVNLHTFVHINGNAQEKNFKGAQISFFHAIKYDQGTLIDCDADVVYIQNLESHQVGSECYQLLKERYPHFYVETRESCLQLIASKYEIRDACYITLSENEGLFDFILTNAQESIAHFYCTQSSTFSISKILLEIALEKIETDFYATKEEIPFSLRKFRGCN